MRIRVNGETKDGRDGMTVADLLLNLGLANGFIAVAVNENVVRKSVYADTLLHDGDRIEILAPMSGG